MFSFQPHNQVLYHLTQLTSVVNPKTTSFSIKSKIKKQNEFKKILGDISSNNLPKATKSYMDILIGKSNMLDVITMFNIKTNNILIVLDQLSTKILKKQLEKSEKWKIFFASRSNFTESREQVLCTQFTEQIILPTIHLPTKHHRTLCPIYIKNPFNSHEQIRSFRTRRNINAELEQKFSVINKFKKWLRYISGTKEKEPTLLKNLLTSQMSTEEYKNISTAYFEGYEAGLKRDSRTGFRWHKLPYVILAATLIGILWYGVYLVASGMRFSVDNIKYKPQRTEITFKDVKGVIEAKQELRGVIEFLKNPEKFSTVGAKLPKGILLVGPPGTGKTLLARAVAGEAGVPFFQTAGSEFDEILVGQGARRIRDLFKAAKELAPAVIFIDELDSVGGNRINSSLHPYANQTVNQLLTEMDGFLQNEGVIVLGATNRRDDLDKALLRPGRFDIEIDMEIPNYMCRKEIFDLYLSKVLTKDVDADYLAKCTVGFTGADIENMVNQAALRAVMIDAERVTMKHLEYAKDKILMGSERKLRCDTETNSITAYHEAGHALVSHYTKDAYPIHKITIVPRGSSLGHTAYLHNKDHYYILKCQYSAQIDSLMGGRAAEELIFGPDKITSGAKHDFQHATKIAEEMVSLFGMSEKVGFVFHPRSKDHTAGPNTNDLIDNEVKRLLQESYERAKMILQKHSKELKELAEALLKYETLSYNDMKAVISGQKFPTEPEGSTFRSAIDQ